MKIKILIASFLKPVNDVRGYEKLALSIAKNNRYKVYSTGYPVISELLDEKVELVPLKSFTKNSFQRIAAPWKVFKIYLKLKPELIIVNSPDLLIITSLYRILFGGKICYDIQENYFRNIWFQKNYPFGIRHVLALSVRMVEIVTSPLFHHFFLAERIYKNQLGFIGRRYTILENKCIKPNPKTEISKAPDKPVFLISGTLATEYGLMEGIDFFTRISTQIPNAKLKIIGHCPNTKTRSLLEDRIKNRTSIETNISATPIPHQQLLQAIAESDFGLLPYIPNMSTKGKWPTKLFEYMAYQLPFVIQTNSLWNLFIKDSGISFDFTRLDDTHWYDVAHQLLHTKFHTTPPPAEIFWYEEEEKLIKVIDDII